MKICVFSPYSNIPELAAITVPNKRKYCERHGYDFLTPPLGGTGINQDEMYGFRRRMPMAIELLKSNKYDWIWVVGVDILVTNHTIKLESIVDDNYGMIVGTEPTGVGMDSYIVRSQKGGLEFIELVASYRNNPIGATHEQSTIDTLCKQNPELLKVLKLVPQRILNAYKYDTLRHYSVLHPGFANSTDCFGNSGEWQPGDFVLHTPGISDEQKWTLLLEACKHVQE